jgi:hypothetical protein
MVAACFAFIAVLSLHKPAFGTAIANAWKTFNHQRLHWLAIAEV